MKICFNCDHENFVENSNCHRCNHLISVVRSESFNIAGFLRRNYPLYGIFGILVAIFEYMLDKLPDDRKFISLFPLLIALYLIVHLIFKGSQIINSRNWLSEEELLRRESGFHFFIFYMIHILLIGALILSFVSKAENAINIVGFALGVFIFIAIFSQNFSHEQNRKSLGILFFSILCLEVVLTLILFLPFMAVAVTTQNFTESEVKNIAFFYTRGTQLLIYLGFGGIIAYFITVTGYNQFSEDSIPLSSIFQDQQGQEQSDNLVFFFGIVVLYGIVLGTFLLSLKSLYAGFN